MRPKYTLWLFAATLAAAWLTFDPAATSSNRTKDAEIGKQRETPERRTAVQPDRHTAGADSVHRKTHSEGRGSERFRRL